MEYSEELNYSITEINYIKELQELFKDYNLVTNCNENGLNSLNCTITRKVGEYHVEIKIQIEFDKTTLYRIKLNLEPVESSDKNNYEMYLKVFYLEEIKSQLFNAINRPTKKYTIRVYKSIFNNTPIYGFYKTKGSNTIAFHSLDIIEKCEPFTEHIICFDVELEERNFERAKSRANNIIADYSGYLAVLLDIGFYEPTSRFLNFVTASYANATKVYKHERFRTAFYDPELKLYVKDNMNGLTTLEDMKKGIYDNGYCSINSLDGVNTMQLTVGNISSIEKAFSSHRIYKTENKVRESEQFREEKCDEINDEPHLLSQQIKVPRQLRRYIRWIEWYKNQRHEKYIHFRDACRLYNKSKILSIEGASLEISFLVACIEALSKVEDNLTFSDFVLKYNKEANKDDLNLLYGIRSKLFHNGIFSFFEYEYDLNPNSDPLFIEFRNKYLLFKTILRGAFINWININLNEFKKLEEMK